MKQNIREYLSTPFAAGWNGNPQWQLKNNLQQKLHKMFNFQYEQNL